MKLASNIINCAFAYVIKMSKMYNIDESHALRHSMDVYHYANNIYNNELPIHPYLKYQKNVIMCSAILHDMCDKKYVDETESIQMMNKYMKNYVDQEQIDQMNKIISTMSYSTVKQKGYPTDLKEYHLAYHIVRESDLLAGYDVERCIIYQMMRKDSGYVDSIKSAKELFYKRVLNYISDDLFITEYSKKKSFVLHDAAIIKIKELENMHFL